MQRKIEKIEKYLNNELSIREQIEFEEELRKDSELMREFLLRRDINEAVKEKDIIELRHNLEEIGKDFSTRKNTRLILRNASIAAVLLILIALASLNLLLSPGLTSQQIVEKYYKVYPSVNSNRSVDTEIDKNIFLAFNSYEASKYENASKYFKIVLAENNSNVMSQFYLAMSLIEAKRLKEAEEYLIDLSLKPNHIFWEQSHWYLAMIYIKQSKTEHAIEVLKKIVEQNMTYKQEAKRILRSIQ